MLYRLSPVAIQIRIDDGPSALKALVAALRERMGDQSQVAFAAALGVKQSVLSRFLDGQLGVGPKTAGCILREYPDLRDLVIAALSERAGKVAA